MILWIFLLWFFSTQWWKVGIRGGMKKWKMLIRRVTLNGLMLKIPCLCSTQGEILVIVLFFLLVFFIVVRLGNRKVFYTRQGDIYCMPQPHLSTFLITILVMCFGVPLTLAGLRGILTACMGLLPTQPLLLSYALIFFFDKW